MRQTLHILAPLLSKEKWIQLLSQQALAAILEKQPN
jgi:hypothetical protein